MTPNHLRTVDWGLRTMRGLPLNDYEKISIVPLLSGYARTCGIIMRDMDRAIQAGSSPGAFSGFDGVALKQLVTSDAFPDLHAVVMSGAYTHDHPEQDPIGDDFEFGLKRILDGIEQYMASKEAQS